MLGKKQNIKNEDWIAAVKAIKETVKKADLDAKVKAAVEDIKEKTKGKKAAYGWSAGKDSLVLGKICEMAGIKKCALVVSDLEYPAFVDWIDKNKPEGLTIINTHQDLQWLQNHPEMLFPQDSTKAAQWFHIVQHRGQAKFYKDEDLDILIRGEHLLEPMKHIVQELLKEGKTVDEIGKQLGMKPEEIFRLSNFSKEDFLKMMAGEHAFSKAEFITKL
ncbi:MULTISPECIES: hypothetical protein [unclassified Bilifractor]|uniref:hypothetical protein n=1 Tax=unclassified Bilifractor TaxID=2815795 RepID=UPI003F8F751F